MNETPNEPAWVEERAKCELKPAFASLQSAVERDVAEYNAIFKTIGNSGIALQNSAAHLDFSVYRKGELDGLVTFGVVGDHIAVRDPWSVKTFDAIPVLTKDGRCVFRVSAEEIEQWQLRRNALEGLFFGPSHHQYITG
jgi:hypothetical protein